MKTSTKKILSAAILVTAVSFAVNAQTNVGGGIFSNTTWTLAGSPYIVVDTVVVFPGVTLTIEPGVTVKFLANMYLEMRQSTIVANGTITDSITFTSNALSPVPGIWGHTNAGQGGIWLNGPTMPSAFNFCNVRYATSGIGGNAGNLPYIKNSTFTYNLIGIHDVTNTPLDSCVFKYNETGIDDLDGCTLNFCTFSNNDMGIYYGDDNVLNYCALDSNGLGWGGATGLVSGNKLHYCSISYNQDGFRAHASGDNLLENCIINYNTYTGVYLSTISGGSDEVISCEIKYNGIGVGVGVLGGGPPVLITKCEFEFDTIGLLVNSNLANIYCNKICNNISYGLQMNTAANFNAANNYWCTTDSAQIADAIYDAYDNVSNGFVTFLPLDSLQCYQATSINEIENEASNFTVFPNPAFEYLTLVIADKVSTAELNIFNVLGELEYSSAFVQPKTKIDVSALSAGIHIIEVQTGSTISRQKFIKH